MVLVCYWRFLTSLKPFFLCITNWNVCWYIYILTSYHRYTDINQNIRQMARLFYWIHISKNGLEERFQLHNRAQVWRTKPQHNLKKQKLSSYSSSIKEKLEKKESLLPFADLTITFWFFGKYKIAKKLINPCENWTNGKIYLRI